MCGVWLGRKEILHGRGWLGTLVGNLFPEAAVVGPGLSLVTQPVR